MRDVLRATALLGSSSAASIVIGLGTAKATALLVGPSGVGMLGLLQSLVSLAVMLFGVGAGVGVVRLAANPASAAAVAPPALARAGWLVTGAGAALAALVLLVFRRPISAALLGSADRAPLSALMALGVAFTLGANLRIGMLNARHRVSALAQLQVVTSLAAGVGTVGCLAIWRQGGIGPAVVAGGLSAIIVAEDFAGREGISRGAGAGGAPTRAAVRELLRFGVPYTGSLIVGSGIQLILPALVLHSLGETEVGYYRAALGLSSGYLTILLAAMSRDYYPRVAAAPAESGVISVMVNQQQRVIMLVGAPIILVLLAFAPAVVPLVYSRSFGPAVEVLEWLLVGELFRFSSWTLAYVILARERSGVYFAMEAAAGLTLLVLSWQGSRLFGLRGIGMAYVVTYVVYLALAYLVVRRRFGPVWRLSNLVPVLGACLAGLLVVELPVLGWPEHRTVAGGLLAITAVAAGGLALRREWGAA